MAGSYEASVDIAAQLRSLPFPLQVKASGWGERVEQSFDLLFACLTDPGELPRAAKLAEDVRSRNRKAQLVLVGSRQRARWDEVALRLKARTFLLYPLGDRSLSEIVTSLLGPILERRRRSEHRRRRSRRQLEGIVGESAEMRNLLALVERVSSSPDTSVLLLGESGTGKSLFARAIHEMSPRADGPFIEINCAAIPSSLLENELFGHIAGAFTDARSDKVGLIELAHGGTLFLDEVTEIEPATQAKLLKFLDLRKIRRLGGSRDIIVDARIVAASNRNLGEEVNRGAFRRDLYYRLNVVAIEIPPLRERGRDVIVLARHFLEIFKTKFRKPDLTLSPEAERVLIAYSWPGNVRELMNTIERAALLLPGGAVTPDDLPLPRPRGKKRLVLGSGEDLELELPPGGVRLDLVEKRIIEETLKLTGGNVLEASRLLGMSRGALRHKLAKYRLDPKRFRGPVLSGERG